MPRLDAAPSLLPELAKIAAEAQRARTVHGVFEIAGQSLWRLGLRLAVSSIQDGINTVQYICDPQGQLAWLRQLRSHGSTMMRGPVQPDGPVARVLEEKIGRAHV